MGTRCSICLFAISGAIWKHEEKSQAEAAPKVTDAPEPVAEVNARAVKFNTWDSCSLFPSFQQLLCSDVSVSLSFISWCVMDFVDLFLDNDILEVNVFFRVIGLVPLQIFKFGDLRL